MQRLDDKKTGAIIVVMQRLHDEDLTGYLLEKGGWEHPRLHDGRAGVEGTISYLKRVLGLSRCFTKGWEHFQATVGASIFAHNLLILARC